ARARRGGSPAGRARARRVRGGAELPGAGGEAPGRSAAPHDGGQVTSLARAIGLVFLVLAVVWSTPAAAQRRATTTAPSTAEAGEPFVVELRVVSDDAPIRAAEPTLTPPIGIAASPPS